MRTTLSRIEFTMSRFQSLLQQSVLVAIIFGSSIAFAAEKGYFGFAISVDAASFSFNPVLKSVLIDKIVPGSPAEAAGLVKGDEFVEVEGHIVAGAKADDVKPYLSRNVDETVNFKITKASGQIVAVSLTAGKKQ